MRISEMLLAALAVALFLLWVRARLHIRERAQIQLDAWREREIESLRKEIQESIEAQARDTLARWKLENETRIRGDAVKRSRAVVTGKVTEHLVPYLGEFPFHPQDVRFLGTPVDLVVFDGMSEEAVRDIVFVEVKTGRGANLSPRERQIRDAVQSGRVRWHELRIATYEPRPREESYFLTLSDSDGRASGQLEVLPAKQRIRYWADWTEAPIEYDLSPEQLARREGRVCLKLLDDNGLPHLLLGSEGRVEVDPVSQSLTIRGRSTDVPRHYVLPPERIAEVRGGLVLKLDGGR